MDWYTSFFSDVLMYLGREVVMRESFEVVMLLLSYADVYNPGPCSVPASAEVCMQKSSLPNPGKSKSKPDP